MSVTVLGQLAAGGQKLPLISLHALAGRRDLASAPVQKHISLADLCGIQEPHSYVMKVRDDSMQSAGIDCGDLVIVDRSQYAEHGDVIFAVLNAEPVCRRLHMRDNTFILKSENAKYPARHVMDEDDLVIWGVVKHCIRSFDKS